MARWQLNSGVEMCLVFGNQWDITGTLPGSRLAPRTSET